MAKKEMPKGKKTDKKMPAFMQKMVDKKKK